MHPQTTGADLNCGKSDLAPETRWVAGPLQENLANSWNKVMGREKGRSLPDLSDDATGQGLRQFWMRLSKHPEQGAFSKAISNQVLNL
jgi:hypothetical protein